MRFETVYNTGTTPQLVDVDGRVIAAGEWACADVESGPAASALAAGRLVVVDTPARSPTGTDPGARDAFTATRAARAALLDESTEQSTDKPAVPAQPEPTPAGKSSSRNDTSSKE